MSKVVERLKAMCAIQAELNKKVHPEWEKQFYPYPDAMFTEATEAYNHLNWEWWKSLGREIQWDQVKMELVDVGHFLFSEVLNNHLEEQFYSSAEEVEADMGPAEFGQVSSIKSSIKHFITNVLLYDEGTEECPAMLYSFFATLKELGLSIDDFYKLYVGKVCLNELRWKNGYKKGIYTVGAYNQEHYVKIWDSQEDNEFLSAKIEELDIDSPTFKQDLSAALEAKYTEVRGKLIEQSCRGI